MQTYSTTERLASKARAAAAMTKGSSILSIIIVLSGLLSAIFFWSFSARVFAEVWRPAALLLGLATGLMPSEGAFFAWKAVRNSKTNMTQKQLDCTEWGVGVAVGCSIFSTFALFVAQFPQVPAVISQYTDWFVFLALSLPIIAQMVIIAKFEVNEADTVQNFERSKLAAMGFNAWINAEQARMQSIIDGIDLALDKQLEGYGQNIGSQEAERMLQGGSQQLLSMGGQSANSGQGEDDTADFDDLDSLVAYLVEEKMSQQEHNPYRVQIFNEDRAMWEDKVSYPDLDTARWQVDTWMKESGELCRVYHNGREIYCPTLSANGKQTQSVKVPGLTADEVMKYFRNPTPYDAYYQAALLLLGGATPESVAAVLEGQYANNRLEALDITKEVKDMIAQIAHNQAMSEDLAAARERYNGANFPHRPGGR